MMKIKYEIHTFGMFQYSSKGIKGKHQITEKGIYELCIQIKQYFPANPFIYSNMFKTSDYFSSMSNILHHACI